MTDFLSRGPVLITGGTGFLGSFLADVLNRAGSGDVVALGKADCDLLDGAATRRLLKDIRPDVVFHLAARVGGIEANRRSPGLFFYENLMMGMNLMEAARLEKVGTFVQVGTVCSYPKHTPIPIRERDLWDGFPEETNAPYGVAKKALLVQLQAYRQEYGMRGVYLIPTNLYGPRDNFDPTTSHVIPALIRKCLEARDHGRPSITVWGTGSPTRDFLFVEDCARALVQAAESYDSPDPLNLGSGREISIRELVQIIAGLTGFRGAIHFDLGFPDGQPRRALDSSRAQEAFGYRPDTELEEGLRRTIAWYEARRAGSPQEGGGRDPGRRRNEP